MTPETSPAVDANPGVLPASRKGASIRSRLMWLVTAILLPVFAVALAGVLYVYKEERASVDRSMRETTRALALVVDREIARREAILKTLATAPDLDREDFASFSRLAKSAAPSLDATIILSDLNGQQLVNSRIPAGQPLPKRVMFNQMREGGNLDGTLVSNLYESPMSRQFSFAVQVPVKRDGEVRFHLTLANHAAQLQPVWSDQRLPQAWIGAVVDKEGKLVARNRDVDRFLGRSASPDMVRSMAERPDGFIESTTLDGISTVSFFSRAPSSGWGVIIGVPRDEVMRSASRAVAVLLAVALVLLGGGLVAAAWVGRTVVRPVRALAQGASALGQGGPVEVGPSGMVETDQVGDALVTADRKIREANQLLEARIASAVAASERAQLALLRNQKLEALGRLTGGIAHDFNNLLQVLSSGLYMLGRNQTEGKARTTIDSCKRAVERGVKLTRQLMTFGKAQPGQSVTVDVGEQLARMSDLMNGVLRADIHLMVNVPEGRWKAHVDPVQFELALLNLVINAKDATPGAGVIRITCTERTLAASEVNELAAGRYLEIEVRDTGAGMSPEVLARAFEPFFTTKEVGQGSGLGLAQVYGFARQYGGAAGVESEPGHGAVVRLWLPQVDEPVGVEPEAAPEPQRAFTSADALQRGRRILVVEDDELVLEVVRTMLESHGFDVVSARSGNEGLERVRADPSIELMFSDVVMPGGMDGIQLAGHTRLLRPELPIVLASGYADRAGPTPDLRMLRKPYELDKLLTALSEEMEGRAVS